MAIVGWLLHKLSLRGEDTEEVAPTDTAPIISQSQSQSPWLLLHSSSPTLVANLLVLLQAKFSVTMALWGTPDLQQMATTIQAQLQMTEIALPINWHELHFRVHHMLPLFGRLPIQQQPEKVYDSPEEVEQAAEAKRAKTTQPEAAAAAQSTHPPSRTTRQRGRQLHYPSVAGRRPPRRPT